MVLFLNISPHLEKKRTPVIFDDLIFTFPKPVFSLASFNFLISNMLTKTSIHTKMSGKTICVHFYHTVASLEQRHRLCLSFMNHPEHCVLCAAQLAQLSPSAGTIV